MFDTAIIGTGPAGLSAATNLKLHNKNVVWFGSPKLSAKVGLSEKIANYPGFPYITGVDLNAAFEEHRKRMELEITDKMVSQIMPMGKSFGILAENDVFEAKTVILAPGVLTTKELEGEKNFLGRGVSYCATCDGFLYKGKTIGVLCTAARFEHEVTYLAEMAAKVYFFPSYKDPAVTGENIETVAGRIAKVNGGMKIASVTLADGSSIALDGLFCLRDSIAPTTLLPTLAAENNRIITDREMATNVPGVFACGDCTGMPYQIAKAVGEGNVAAHSVVRYLAAGNKEGK